QLVGNDLVCGCRDRGLDGLVHLLLDLLLDLAMHDSGDPLVQLAQVLDLDLDCALHFLDCSVVDESHFFCGSLRLALRLGLCGTDDGRIDHAAHENFSVESSLGRRGADQCRPNPNRHAAHQRTSPVTTPSVFGATSGVTSASASGARTTVVTISPTSSPESTTPANSGGASCLRAWTVTWVELAESWPTTSTSTGRGAVAQPVLAPRTASASAQSSDSAPGRGRCAIGTNASTCVGSVS